MSVQPSYPLDYTQILTFEQIHNTLKTQYESRKEALEEGLFTGEHLKGQIELQNQHAKNSNFIFDKEKTLALKETFNTLFETMVSMKAEADILRDQLKIGGERLTKSPIQAQDITTLETMDPTLKEKTLLNQTAMQECLKNITQMHADMEGVCTRFSERVPNIESYKTKFDTFVGNKFNQPATTSWFGGWFGGSAPQNPAATTPTPPQQATTPTTPKAWSARTSTP